MRDTDDRLDHYIDEIAQLKPSDAHVDAADPALPPMLHAAVRLRRVAMIEPSPAVVQRTRAALLRPVTNGARHTVSARRQLWQRRGLALAFAVVLLLALGTTSVLAAPAALPGSPLYAVRNLREDVEVGLAGTAAQRARLYVGFAVTRSSQLRELAQQPSGASPAVVQTLLRDIGNRIHEADQQAQADGQDARSAVQQGEREIQQQLNQVGQQGGFSGAEGNALARTLQEVQSSESGLSGDSGSNENLNQP
jgi:hypothetical protein